MLEIDASTPALTGNPNSPWVSPSFTPPNNSLLVVVAMGIGTGAASPVLTPTSADLIFDPVVTSGVNNGYVRIYLAEVGGFGGVARTVSVATNMADLYNSGAVKVFVLTGHRSGTPLDSTGIGGTDGVNDFVPGGPPALQGMAITPITVSHGSWVFGGFSDWAALDNAGSSEPHEIWRDATVAAMAVREPTWNSGDGDVVFGVWAGGNYPQWAWAFVSIAAADPPPWPQASSSPKPSR
jgi:hypothetical protein